MNSFYCQGRIEGDSMCETQCDHCKEYYKPLVGEGWEHSWKEVNKQLPCGVNPQAYRLGWLDGVSESERHKKDAARLRAIMKLAFDLGFDGEKTERDKMIEELKSERERSKKLLEALDAAVNVIKQWHRADDVWGIYYNRAPEMKPIRDTITEYKNNNQ